MQIVSLGDNLHEMSKLVFSKETICMKFQSLLSGKNKKNIVNLSSAKLAKRVVKV